MENPLPINENENENENEVVNMDDPNLKLDGKKKKKIIIISIIIVLALLITIIAVTLSFTLKVENELEPLVFNSTSGNHTHTIIFMPGYSNRPEDFKKVLTQKINFSKKNDTTIVVLRSPKVPITYNNTENYAWYDIIDIPLDDLSDINFDDLKNSAKVLERYINNEVNILNGDYGKIIIGGHSQGASIAMYQAYNAKVNYGGVFAFSGFLPPGNLTGEKRILNTYMGFGDHDDVILPEFINKSIDDIMTFEGFNLYIYKGHKHHVCTAQTIDVGKFLDRIIK